METKKVTQLGKQQQVSTNDVKWSPDRKWIAAVGGGVPADGGTLMYAGWIKLFHADTGAFKRRARLGMSRVLGWAAAWSPDSKLIVGGTDDGVCQVYNAPELTTVFAKRIHRLRVTSLSWHPTETRIASGSTDRTVVVWDSQNGDIFLKFELDATVQHVSWSPNGQRLAALDGAGKIHVWDASRGEKLSKTDRLAERIQGQLNRDMLGSLTANDLRSALEHGTKMLQFSERRGKQSWGDYHLLATLSAALGEREKYASICNRMLENYSLSKDVESMYFAVWTSIVLPGALEDYEPTIQLARRVVASDPVDRQFTLLWRQH